MKMIYINCRQASHRSGRDRVLERAEKHEKAKAAKPSGHIKNQRAHRLHKMAHQFGDLGPQVMPQPRSSSKRNIIPEEPDPLGHLKLLPHRPHAPRPLVTHQAQSPQGLRGRKLPLRKVLHSREPLIDEVPHEAQHRREPDGFKDRGRD